MKTTERKFPLWLLWLLLLAALLFFRGPAAQAASDGIVQCIQVLIPSLFPFFVLSNLLLATDFPDRMARLLQRPMQSVFHLNPNGAVAVVIGFLGGYPVGAKLTALLCKHGKLTREEAEQLLLASNNTGPAIFFGMIGGILHWSFSLLAASYLIHIVSALVTALLMRPGKAVHSPSFTTTAPPENSSLIRAILDAVNSLVLICAFVLVFSILLGLLRAALACFFPALAENPFVFGLLAGAMDIPNGIQALSHLNSEAAQFLLANVFVNWCGFCVHLQTKAVLQDVSLSMRRYLPSKLVQALVCAALCVWFLLVSAGKPAALWVGLGLLVFFFVIWWIKSKMSVEKPRETQYNRAKAKVG